MEVDEKEKENQLQDERYDRTVRALTAEVALKIMKSRVAISPLNGVTTEFMKNIVLDGANVTMFDDSPVTEDDLGTNFMFSPNDLGKVKGEILKQKFNEMNPYSQIEYKPLLNINQLYAHVTERKEDILKDYDTLAVSTTSFAEMILWDKLATLLNKPLYILNCCGLCGFIWINLGSQFTFKKLKVKTEVLNVAEGDDKVDEEETKEYEDVVINTKSLEECLNPNVRGKSGVFYAIMMMYEAERNNLKYDPFNPDNEVLERILNIGKQFFTANKFKYNETIENTLR